MYLQKALLFFLLTWSIVSCTPTSLSDSNDKELFLIDSIRTIYKETSQTEPEKVKQLIKEQQQQVKDSMNYYTLSNMLAVCYFQLNQFDSAQITNKSTLNFCSRQPQTKQLIELQAKASNDIGVFYKFQDQRDSAIIYLEKAANLFRKINDLQYLPDIYLNLADCYHFDGDFAETTSHYRKALFVVDSLESDSLIKLSIYSGLGKVYTDLRNYPLAEYYYNLVEDKWENMSLYDQYYFANTMTNHYYQRENYPEALSWLYKALNIVNSLNQPIPQAVVEGNLGEVYLLLNQNDSAKHYLDKSASLFSSPDDFPSFYYYIQGLYAHYYIETNQLNQAEKILTQTYDPTFITPNYIFLQNKRLEKLYAKKGNYQKAYIHLKKSTQYDDSLRNTIIQRNIAEIDQRYRQDTTLLKRDILIAQQKQKVLKLRYTNNLILLFIIILFLIIAAFYLYLRKKREKRYNQQLTYINKLRTESIRNNLFSHYTFNVLNATIPPLRKYPDLIEPLDLLITNLRSNLLISNEIKIPLKEEVELVKNYVALRKSIHSKTPSIQWNVEEEVNLETIVPSMSLQIPVENAIKHAFTTEDENNRITIDIFKEENHLIIQVRDNGLGYNPKRPENNKNNTGKGISILFKTIELFNRKNSEKITLTITTIKSDSPTDGGTLFKMKIPFNYKYNV